MGTVMGITSTKFPAQGRDVGMRTMLSTRWAILPATILRQDRDRPHNVIWKVSAESLPGKYFSDDQDLYMSFWHEDNYPKDNLLVAAGELEGKFVDVVFDCDNTNKCEALCVTDRGGMKVFRILTGAHVDRFVDYSECEYKEKPQ